MVIFLGSYIRDFLSTLQKALILAMNKVPVPFSPPNFRPIALLCFLSKILEKLAQNQIVSYLVANKILDPLQAGFRRHESTETALLKLTDDIRLAMDRKYVTVLLPFDFSETFDTISPSRLLTKLKDMGFSKSALSWIHSFLTSRSQCVIFHSTTSESLDTNLGVPQGSVLGPLRFCFYVNDLHLHLRDPNVFRILYADDLQIYVYISLNRVMEEITSLFAAV